MAIGMWRCDHHRFFTTPISAIEFLKLYIEIITIASGSKCVGKKLLGQKKFLIPFCPLSYHEIKVCVCI